jgi:hypothetical protein
MTTQGMCPHCGAIFPQTTDLVPSHDVAPLLRQICPGAHQHWRNPLSDGRPLWNGKANPHFYRNQEQS